jgi:hypothetical protein
LTKATQSAISSALRACHGGVLQKQQYAHVLQSLETSPAQDVVVLLLHLEQELRLAVRTGSPTFDMVTHTRQQRISEADLLGSNVKLSAVATPLHGAQSLAPDACLARGPQ